MHKTYSTSFSTLLHFLLAPSLEKTEDFLRLILIDCCDDCETLAIDGGLYRCTRRNAATYVRKHHLVITYSGNGCLQQWYTSMLYRF